MNQYTPTVDKIVHKTTVDFAKRSFAKVLHITQYDRTLPVLAVSMTLNDKPYVLPEGAEANIRFGKKDHTFVYNPALGCNADRTVVYFEITYQMTVEKGRFSPIVEILIGDNAAGSSAIEIEVDRNPIQEDDIASSVEWKSFDGYVEDAQAAAESASADAQTAQDAAESAEVAKETAVEASDAAAAAAEAAKTSEVNAKASEVAAGKSEANAKTSETNAAASADRAEQAAVKNGYATFRIDNKTGHVYLIRTTNIVDKINFRIDKKTGRMQAIIKV